MIDFRRRMLNGKPVFSKAELGLILGVYSKRVQKGEWRDYAIDSLSHMAVFSIFRSSREAPIYSIAKISRQGLLKPAQYVVYSGDKALKEGHSLSEVLAVFENVN